MFEEQNSGCGKMDTGYKPSCGGEKRTYSVGDIQRILDISRSTAYALIRRGLFKSQKVGKQIRISKKSFDAWLDGEGE